MPYGEERGTMLNTGIESGMEPNAERESFKCNWTNYQIIHKICIDVCAFDFSRRKHTSMFITISDISPLIQVIYSMQIHIVPHVTAHTTVFNSYSYRTDNRTQFFPSGNVWTPFAFLFIRLWSTAISSNCNVLSIILHAVSHLLGMHRQMSIVFDCVNPFFKIRISTRSIIDLIIESIENIRKANGWRMNFYLKNSNVENLLTHSLQFRSLENPLVRMNTPAHTRIVRPGRCCCAYKMKRRKYLTTTEHREPPMNEFMAWLFFSFPFRPSFHSHSRAGMFICCARIERTTTP